MTTYQFKVLDTTPSGNVLMECIERDKPAVAKPTRAFAGRKHVLTIVETIASVANPYYVGRPAPGVVPEKLVGQQVDANVALASLQSPEHKR